MFVNAKPYTSTRQKFVNFTLHIQLVQLKFCLFPFQANEFGTWNFVEHDILEVPALYRIEL